MKQDKGKTIPLSRRLSQSVLGWHDGLLILPDGWEEARMSGECGLIATT
jgi:hypothetical protein